MIQVYSNTPTAILEGGTLPFLSSVERRGCTTALNGGSISIRHKGIYLIVANFSFAPTAAGDVIITMQRDGVESLVNIGSETAAAAGDIVNITIPSIVTADHDETRCCGAVPITYTVNVAGTLISANATVTKYNC